MPTIPSIRTSVENKDILVLDNHAKNGTFEKDARGRLIAYTGGFSVVFPYRTANGEKWAFRCWHSDIKNSKKRYETISKSIKNAKLSFLCEFQYIDKGINVEGNIYSTTRMRWIDGMTIKDYICQNRNSKDLLIALADNFLKMTQALHAQSLAHGDLQHGNILVDKNHQLYLVDYDSFYCPRLKGEADTVTGLADYQHPARINNKSVSEKLDYFSELIIYLSILAIAENPLLVDKYKVNDADRLLFSKEDFVDIKSSEVYKDIQGLGKEFQDLLDVLEGYLKCSSIDELLPFETYLLENRITFTSSATKAVRNTQVVSIEWDVPFEAEVSLKRGKDGDLERCENKGCISTALCESITYELHIKKPGVSEIRKQITIEVFDECKIDFSADKYYIFPTIPVKLSWNVEHAKRVWLDNEEVNVTGTKVIEPKKATTCVLSAEDEFGVKEKRVDIQMLPIPQVKSLLVPVPDITNNLSVTIQQPKYNVDVKFPTIDIDWIKVEVPRVKSLTELGLYRSLEQSPPQPRINLMSSIKKVFNQIIRK
jgi:serine/threonine protein kinase